MDGSGIARRLAVLAVVVGAAACDVGGDAPVLGVSEIDCPTAPDVEIDVVDHAFRPAEVSVPSGAIVRWTNRGANEHTVTSGDPDSDSAGALFASDDLEPGDTFCVEVTGRGAASYHCEYHPDRMRARLEVGAVATGGDGGATGGATGGGVYD